MKQPAKNLTMICCIVLSIFLYNTGRCQELANRNFSKKSVKIGYHLYEKYGCITCHGKGGKGKGDLTRAFLKYEDDQIKSYIKNPRFFNNSTMPVYDGIITESDLVPLVLYIKWLGAKSKRKSN